MKKISLRSAILININIIIGAGIFLNITPLAKIAGRFSFASYLLSAAILAPFVFILAKLASENPVPGGLYVYSKEHLSPFFGFVSGWCYFIGKTVSAAFLAHAFTSYMQTKISFLQNFPTVALSCITIFSLIFLNICGAHICGKIQYAFIFIKIIPFLFVFLFGIFSVGASNSTFPALTSLVATIPIALYPLMGFEITCAIGHLIKNPQKNIFRAISWSFAIVVATYALFQFFVVAIAGNNISGSPLVTFTHVVLKNEFVGRILTSLVFTSVIAGSFGILSSNCWNLYALESKRRFFALTTKTGIPWVSLCIEGIIACGMLLLSQNQISLQSMSVFGVVVSFLLSAIAALKKYKNIISIAAVASCLYILFLCFEKIRVGGTSIPYIALLIAGIILGTSPHIALVGLFYKKTVRFYFTQSVHTRTYIFFIFFFITGHHSTRTISTRKLFFTL